MRQDEAFGIGPCMITDLPLVKADNERQRQAIIEREQQYQRQQPLDGLVIKWHRLTTDECLALWPPRD